MQTYLIIIANPLQGEHWGGFISPVKIQIQALNPKELKRDISGVGLGLEVNASQNFHTHAHVTL